ncbi:MAG: DUF350 domain-containing protein [Candidatus Parcubacteria bacterium]|nr:DUF350 domain-containing protein [Candidatus Parcubacteria bacterium]
MYSVLTNYVLVLGWILATIVVLAGGIAILAWLLRVFTDEINVWKEIRRKNMAVAVIIAATILSVSLLVGLILK